MKKPIDNIAKGRDTVTTILAEFLKSKLRGSSTNFLELELKDLLIAYRSCVDDIHKNGHTKYYKILSHLIYNYRNIDSHTAASPQAKAKDPMFIGSALDSMRIFTDYLVDEINKHRKDFKITPLEKPLYKYKMDYPKNLNKKIDTKSSHLFKAPNYVRIPHYPFDFTRFAYVRFDGAHYQEILEALNYFQLGDKILFAQTYGDNFAYYEDRTGYIGNCREEQIFVNGNNTIEVDKIIIIHFYEGEMSSKAHFYLADYENYEIRSEYERRRYRYHFKNIFSCGDIEEDIIGDTKETATVVIMPYF